MKLLHFLMVYKKTILNEVNKTDFDTLIWHGDSNILGFQSINIKIQISFILFLLIIH